MNELLPILGGVLAGMFAGLVPCRARMPAATLLASVVAVVATVVSGEYRISWSYVLIDAALAIVAALGMTLVPGVMRFRSSSDNSEELHRSG